MHGRECEEPGSGHVSRVRNGPPEHNGLSEPATGGDWERVAVVAAAEEEMRSCHGGSRCPRGAFWRLASGGFCMAARREACSQLRVLNEER